MQETFFNKFRSACCVEWPFLYPQSFGDKILLAKCSICWWKTSSNIFEIRGKRLIGLSSVLLFWSSFLKTGTISAISKSSGKVPVDMELFIQFVIAFAICSFAILIIFAGIFALKLFLQPISSMHFMTWSVLTS